MSTRFIMLLRKLGTNTRDSYYGTVSPEVAADIVRWLRLHGCKNARVVSAHELAEAEAKQ